MTTNAVLDVAAGLMFMYLVLSLICSSINEFLASMAKLRANTLQKALKELIDVPTLHADFYNHGLIAGNNAAKGGTHVSYMSGRTFASAILGSLDPTQPLPTLTGIESSVKCLPDSNVRDALLAHLISAQGNIDRFRHEVSVWFDQAMDRVSGTYKRKLKIISLGVGLLIAVILNADTLHVADALWRDGDLRAEIVQSVHTAVDSGIPPTTAGSNSKAGSLAAIQQEELNLRPMPIGWQTTSEISWFSCITKFFGLLLTAVALSLGAPFWFDVLSKFMNLRGAGARPERTPEVFDGNAK